jgi:hypothetical protein
MNTQVVTGRGKARRLRGVAAGGLAQAGPHVGVAVCRGGAVPGRFRGIVVGALNGCYGERIRSEVFEAQSRGVNASSPGGDREQDGIGRRDRD